MKYAKTRVKCSTELLTEIDKFMKVFDNCSDGLADFLLEVKEGVLERLELARRRNEKEGHLIYAEFFMVLPKSVYERAKKYIGTEAADYSELYLLFENISRVKEGSFKR